MEAGTEAVLKVAGALYEQTEEPIKYSGNSDFLQSECTAERIVRSQ